MEGYRLRSRSVPSDTRAPDSVPPPRPIDAPCALEGPVDESGPVGLCRLGDPELGSHSWEVAWEPNLYAASSGRSGLSLRALLPDPPQEVRDVRAQDDQAEVPDPEAYANVWASISLPGLAAGAAANVGATTSLAIGLGLTTQHTPSARSEVAIGRAPGRGDSAPATHRHLTRITIAE